LRPLTLLLFLAINLPAQTTVYMRGNGLGTAIQFSGMVGGNPPTITTSTNHGLTVGDVVGIWGVCAGNLLDIASARTPANGFHKVLSATPTTFTISDGPTSNTPLNEPNSSVFCVGRMADYTPTAAWVAKYQAQTLPAGPLGWFDGANGRLLHKFYVGTTNGLSSVVVSGCPGACVVTVTVTPSIASIYPDGLNAGDKFSINGTTSSTLNTHGGGNKQDPYTVASTTSTSFTSTVTSGLTNGSSYATNNACGPNADDTATGTAPCVRVSLVAYNGNPMWDSLVTASGNMYGAGNPTHYLFPKDNPTGGYTVPGSAYESANEYSSSAFRCASDPTDTTSCNVAIYFMKNVEQSFGVNWPCYSDPLIQACGVSGGGLQGDQDEIWIGLAQITALMVGYLSPTSRQTYIDKLYNDTADPGSTVSEAHANLSGDRLNPLISTGKIQAASATAFTLDPSDTKPNGYYVNNVVHLAYVTPIVSWTPGGGSPPSYYEIETTGNWGFNAQIPTAQNPIALGFTGVTGTKCTGMNSVWILSDAPGTPLDATHFRLRALPGCDAPSGGSVISYDVNCTIYNTCTGHITGYDSTTKVATVSGGFKGSGTASGTSTTPTTDMTYKIFQSISISNSTPYATATVTGYNTHFTTDVAVGDIVIGADNIIDFCGGQVAPWVAGSYVTAINSDTSLSVLNMNCTSARSTPKMLWYLHSWQAGDAGFKWYGNHWQGAFGKPVAHPASGGGLLHCSSAPSGVCFGANNDVLYSMSRAGLAMALAPYDPRAVEDIGLAGGYASDFMLSYFANYFAGQMQPGGQYSLGVLYAYGFMAQRLFAPFTGFPANDTAFAKSGAQYKLYSLLPDMNWNAPTPRPTPMAFGNQSSQLQIDSGSAMIQAYGLDPIFGLAPFSTEAKQLAYFMGPQWSAWNSNVAHRLKFDGIAALHNDPRTLTAATSYLSAPLQRIFNASNAGVCTSLLGTSGPYCPPAMKSGSFISRTTWTDPLATPPTGRTGTLTYFGARTMVVNDHDSPQCGVTYISKVGQLIGLDGTGSNSLLDTSTDLDFVRINGTGTNRNFGLIASANNGLPAISFCPVTHWYQNNHGSLDPAYGDQSSKTVYGCAALHGAYFPGTIDFGSRCVADLKDTALNGGTGEQVIVQKTLVDSATTSQPIETYIHYSQNRQTYDGAETVGDTYNEGDTTCPGGCENINTNRIIQSVEDGVGPVTVSIVSITPGNPTGVVTSGPGSPYLGIAGSITGVVGTGLCNGWERSRQSPTLLISRLIWTQQDAQYRAMRVRRG